MLPGPVFLCRAPRSGTCRFSESSASRAGSRPLLRPQRRSLAFSTSKVHAPAVLPSLPCARLAVSLTKQFRSFSMRLADIAQKLCCRLEGRPEIEIHGVAGIEHAEAGQITFLANRRYFPLLKTTRASAVLIAEGIAPDREAALPPPAALRSSNPYLAFAPALALFF